MNVDKNQAVIDFLKLCPAIRDNPLFFNFIKAKDNTRQIVTQTNDRNINRPYIDGSVLKQYTFTIMDFRSISATALVQVDGYPNENVDEFADVQNLIDWIDEQAELHNFPDFGRDCYIDEMYTTSSNPALLGIDNTVTPALAQYSITIRINYLDTSKVIWNKQ